MLIDFLRIEFTFHQHGVITTRIEDFEHARTARFSEAESRRDTIMPTKRALLVHGASRFAGSKPCSRITDPPDRGFVD